MSHNKGASIMKIADLSQHFNLRNQWLPNALSPLRFYLHHNSSLFISPVAGGVKRLHISLSFCTNTFPEGISLTKVIRTLSSQWKCWSFAVALHLSTVAPFSVALQGQILNSGRPSGPFVCYVGALRGQGLFWNLAILAFWIKETFLWRWYCLNHLIITFQNKERRGSKS